MDSSKVKTVPAHEAQTDCNKIKTVPAHEAQDGLQQDQNGKSFIYFNVLFHFL